MGGGVLWSQNWKYSKCQDLQGALWSQNWKYSKCQDLPKFQFLERGGAFWSEIPENLDKNLLFEVKCTETCLCITDSLSHTTYVETNEDKVLKFIYGKTLFMSRV